MLASPIEPTGESLFFGESSGTGDTASRPVETGSQPIELTTTAGRATDSATPTASIARDSSPDRFDDTRSHSSTREAEVEVASANPILEPRPLRDAVRGLVRNKRGLAIAAASALVLAVVLVFALGGDSDETSAAAPATPPQQVTEQKAAEPPPEPPSEPAQVTEQASDAELPPPEPPAEPPPPSEAPPATSRPTHAGNQKAKPQTLGGKRIVLEYDAQTRDAKPVPDAPKDDQAAIARARTSYAAGNQKLFAGDADSAIRNYRQSLAYYPAYVAGYRGLGLAYAQKGDKAKALQALRTYLRSVPKARDAPLIRKRIQMLSN